MTVTAQIKAFLLLGIVAAMLAGFFGLRAYYIGVGERRERARQDAETVQSLTSLLESHKALIQAANLASQDMSAALAKRREADTQSTRRLKDALKKTAADRVGCRFDAASLRVIDEARARSAAAAAGGLRGAATAPAGALGR